MFSLNRDVRNTWLAWVDFNIFLILHALDNCIIFLHGLDNYIICGEHKAAVTELASPNPVALVTLLPC